jgi:hypothetical protein
MKRAALLATTGCSDAIVADVGSLGSPNKVSVYSGGKLVAEYESTGYVESTDGGRFYFKDSKTGKHVVASGTVVVEQK